MKQLSLLVLLFAIGGGVYGQQDLMVSQYTFNHAYLNPAATGVKGYYNATLMYRNQWVQFEGAPISQFLSVDGPVISDKMGLGLLLQNEAIGVNKQTDIAVNYSYIIDMDKLKLSMGLRGGMSMFSTNYTDHKVWDTQDEIFQKNTTSYLPNFGFGVYLKHENYYASFSIPHLLNYAPQTTFSLNSKNSNQLVRHYYLMGGYRFHVGDDFVIEPTMLVKYAPNSPTQLDGNLLLEYKEFIIVGAGYRTDNSFIVLSKLQISNKFQLGYSFDINTNDVKDYSKGSHEVMVNFIFGDKGKVKTQSFF